MAEPAVCVWQSDTLFPLPVAPEIQYFNDRSLHFLIYVNLSFKQFLYFCSRNGEPSFSGDCFYPIRR